jgi:RhtB (resistance to homoserine/threonine) family protein
MIIKFLNVALIQFIALLSPGPDIALVLKNSVLHSRFVSFMAVLGISCGALFYAILSVSGFGYITSHYPHVFIGIKLSGALFLFYLGLSSIRHYCKEKKRSEDSKLDKTLNQVLTAKKAFWQGLFTNLSNPKAIIYFVSVFSQFINKETTSLFIFGIVIEVFVLTLFYFALVANLFSFNKLKEQCLKKKHLIELITGVFFVILSPILIVEIFFNL